MRAGVDTTEGGGGCTCVRDAGAQSRWKGGCRGEESHQFMRRQHHQHVRRAGALEKSIATTHKLGRDRYQCRPIDRIGLIHWERQDDGGRALPIFCATLHTTTEPHHDWLRNKSSTCTTVSEYLHKYTWKQDKADGLHHHSIFAHQKQKLAWLYLARRSDRQGAPVLICPVHSPTAMSAM